MFSSLSPVLISQTLAAAAVLALAALLSVSAAPRGSAATIAPVRIALSALGSLSSYQSIASDTLALVDKGDIPAARARIKDLETAWDKAEGTLKPKDKATWTELDGLIDAALADLRTPNPKRAACTTSLKALIAKMEVVDHA